MARIAYKEWKERKEEEDKIRRKRERMERREQMMIQAAGYPNNRDAIQQLRRQAALRDANNGGEVMLAYGMNKNLKKLRDTRPKSAKPLRNKKAKQQLQHYIPQQQQQ